MSKIQLSENSGFTVIPKGETVFKVTEVVEDNKFNKTVIFKLKTASGLDHVEKYEYASPKGEMITNTWKALSFLVRTIMNDYDLSEIDPSETVGKYFKANVTHDIVQSNKEVGKMLTFVHLEDKAPAAGFETSAKVENVKTVVSLDDLLN